MTSSSPRKGADPRDRYQLVQKIGEGGYGSVFKAYDMVTSTTVAVKLIDLEDVGDELDDVHQEIAVMSDVNCPQLIKYYASYIIGMNLWIIMEFLEAGSLSDVLKESGPLDEPSIAYVMRELLLALAYLHTQRKIHRDVKAANLLLSADGSVRLADFGVTGQLTDSMDKRKTRVGTPFWMAPEVITQSLYDGCADIWSMGITAIELAKGLPPYAREVHPMQVIFMIPKNPSPVLEGDFSTELKDFIACCLKKNPTERPSAVDLLQHDFIRNASKPPSFETLVKNKIELNLARMEADAALLESRGLTRIRSVDSGWDFTARSGFGSMNLGSSSSSGTIAGGGGDFYSWGGGGNGGGGGVRGPTVYVTAAAAAAAAARGGGGGGGSLAEEDHVATTRVLRRFRSQDTDLGTALQDFSVRGGPRQMLNSRPSGDINGLTSPIVSPRLSPTLSPPISPPPISEKQPHQRSGGPTQREPFTPIRFGNDGEDDSGEDSGEDIDEKIDRVQAFAIARGYSTGSYSSSSSGSSTGAGGAGAGGAGDGGGSSSGMGLISSHTVTWDRDAPTPPRHRRGQSECYPNRNPNSNSLSGDYHTNNRSSQQQHHKISSSSSHLWTPSRRRDSDAEPVEIFEKRPAYQYGSHLGLQHHTGGQQQHQQLSAYASRSSDSDANDSVVTHSSEELKHSLESEDGGSRRVSRVSSIASVSEGAGAVAAGGGGGGGSGKIRSFSNASFDGSSSVHGGAGGGGLRNRVFSAASCRSNDSDHSNRSSVRSSVSASGSISNPTPRERLEQYHDRERQMHMMRSSTSSSRGPHRDKDRDSGAGLAPFKSVLNVLLRNQMNKSPGGGGSSFSPLFESVLRPALQKISDLANEPASPATAPSPSQSSSSSGCVGGDSTSASSSSIASRAKFALERTDSAMPPPPGDDDNKNRDDDKTGDTAEQLQRQRLADSAAATATAAAAAAAEEHQRETRDLVTVLIAALTALDQHTEGELTNELATTMMGYMMEELDGNVF